jgi:hypothetical protein
MGQKAGIFEMNDSTREAVAEFPACASLDFLPCRDTADTGIRDCLSDLLSCNRRQTCGTG